MVCLGVGNFHCQSIHKIRGGNPISYYLLNVCPSFFFMLLTTECNIFQFICSQNMAISTPDYCLKTTFTQSHRENINVQQSRACIVLLTSGWQFDTTDPATLAKSGCHLLAFHIFQHQPKQFRFSFTFLTDFEAKSVLGYLDFLFR